MRRRIAQIVPVSQTDGCLDTALMMGQPSDGADSFGLRRFLLRGVRLLRKTLV